MLRDERILLVTSKSVEPSPTLYLSNQYAGTSVVAESCWGFPTMLTLEHDDYLGPLVPSSP